MTAQIIPFPQRRTCNRCIHFERFDCGAVGRCMFKDELVVNAEQAARCCAIFEAP